MKNFFLLITTIVVFSFYGCETDQIRFDDLISDIEVPETLELIANGSDTKTFSIIYVDGATEANINATASINNGVIVQSGTNEHTLTFDRLPRGFLRSEFQIRSSTVFSDAVVEININEYRRLFTLTSIKSNPNSISVEISQASVVHNFIGQVTIQAILRNELGLKVSNGTKVVFRDVLEDGSPAGGVFLNLQDVSNVESMVSAVYSPGVVDPEQFVTIIVEVLDENGDVTSITDMEQLYIISE